MLSSWPLSPLVTLALAALGGAVLYHVLFKRSRYPTNLPRLGRKPGQTGFSLRTRLQYYTDCLGLYAEAYRDYSTKGKTVLIPGLGARSEVILPQNAMPWALSLPESRASLIEVIVEIDNACYSLGDDLFARDPWQGMLVKTELNKILETLAVALNDELELAFDRFLGTNAEQWTTLDLSKVVRQIMNQAGSRFIIGGSDVGVATARDLDYIDTCMAMNEDLVRTGGIGYGSSDWMRPITAGLSSWNSKRKLDKIREHLRPIYEERKKLVEQAKRGETPDFEPHDQFQLMMQYASKHRKDQYESLEAMTRRLALANFGAMHQTGIQVTNLILNILGTDAQHDTISTLRQEFQSTLHQNPITTSHKWTKAQIAAMKHADSIARETMRLQSFGNRSVFRKVMVDDLVTPDGILLPKNSIFSFVAHPAATDTNIFGPNALEFDPWRFSRGRPSTTSDSTDERHEADAGTDAGATTPRNKHTFVTTSPHHLPFGHGKHACPGRFLVDFEMKMIMVYLLDKYEMRFPAQYGGKRPENVWVAEAIMPPPNCQIEVRRRA